MVLDFKNIPKFCISLTRSTERRKLVTEQFEAHNLDVKFLDAVDRNDLILPELSTKENPKAQFPEGTGILACMLSHKKAYNMALALDYEAICVFEDDVVLCDDFADRIKYIESLPGLDFDFFLLGGHFSSEIEGSIKGCAKNTGHNRILRVISAGGSYAYIITKKVMEFCVRNLHYNWGMDEFLSTNVYSRFHCYCFMPFLVTCRPCKSEITQVFWEYKRTKTHYQQLKLENINEPFVNTLDSEQELINQRINEERELKLRNGG